MSDAVAQLAAAAFAFAVVVGPMILGTWLAVRAKRQARRDRRSPLSTHLMRTPGETLRQQLEDGRIDTALDLALLMVLPGLLLTTLYAAVLVTGRPTPPLVVGAVLVVIAAFTAWQVRGLLQRRTELDQLRLGLDAEMAAGQELDRLMRQGAAVFHDFPCDKFNIDHVVVAPQGVFAVETKGYRKPNRGGGTADATVVFDGTTLRFPDFTTDKPLKQVQRNAKWLSEWLSSATGERTAVTAVLALPGWFVDRQGRSSVLVMSGGELEGNLLKARYAQPLTAEQVQRVEHQVEQRCRSVEPTYRPDEER